jgi:V/A-type H+-transporting ATPase subunit A
MNGGGTITRISGPVIEAKNMRGSRMGNVVRVGKDKLIGEIIRLNEDNATIQVYEETTGIKPEEPVVDTGMPLSVELGPGLLASIYDGIQRPLPEIKLKTGDFIARGVDVPSLDRKRRWHFNPKVKKGDKVQPGDVLGEIQETSLILHRILVPFGMEGKLTWVAPEGKYTLDEPIAKAKKNGNEKSIYMYHRWPVRKSRPVLDKIPPEVPLVTGQRIFDTLFPLVKGGTAAIPGGFGTGKCVAGSTPVMLTDGTTRRIDEIWKDNSDKDPEFLGEDEKFVKPKKPIRVFSFRGGKIVEREASRVYKGKTSGKTRIVTESGRKVEVTAFHKLPVVNEALEVIWKPAGDIKQGELLLVPRRIPFTPNPAAESMDLSQVFGKERIVPAGMKEVSRAIRRLAERLGGMEKLAKKLGVSYDALNCYKLGKKKARVEFVEKLQKLGEWIPIYLNDGKGQSKQVRIPTRMDWDLAEFTGLVVANGTLTSKCVRFFNQDPSLQNPSLQDPSLLGEFASLAARLFGLEAKLVGGKTGKMVEIESSMLVRFLKWLGVTSEKWGSSSEIPRKVVQGPDKIAARFLGAYSLCKGYFSSQDAELEMVSSSQKLTNQLSCLLARLGIVQRVKEGRGESPYRILVQGRSGIEEFLKECSFGMFKLFTKMKKCAVGEKCVSQVSATVSPSNSLAVEACPIFSEERAFAGDAGMNTGMSADVSAGMSELPAQEKPLNDRAPENFDFEYNVRNPAVSAFSFNWLENNFICDPVKEKGDIPGDGWVYDLEIPETHNFIGGLTPMILHNTVSEHQLAKWSDAKIVVYIGCGERGNEMTDVLQEFPELEDPKTGEPLINRTVLIANTSNMPVAAREASVYTGITIAEYYRDMGYDVAVMADSTSRWAEALREISGRLEEMPGEEGYPAYLGSRLADFYERAGRVRTLGSKPGEGSISIVGAVSPPGGDFSEPVTQNTLRIVKVFWALDTDLADRRHFPSVNWLRSYSLYLNEVGGYRDKGEGKDWFDLRKRAMNLLQQEAELEEVVKLVGPEALAPKDRIALEGARMIREDFLQQSAFHQVDTYCPEPKQFQMLRIILDFYSAMSGAIESGKGVDQLLGSKNKERIARMKTVPNEEYKEKFRELEEDIEKEKKEWGI